MKEDIGPVGAGHGHAGRAPADEARSAGAGAANHFRLRSELCGGILYDEVYAATGELLRRCVEGGLHPQVAAQCVACLWSLTKTRTDAMLGQLTQLATSGECTC